MAWQWTPYTIPLVTAGAVSIALALHTWSPRRLPTSRVGTLILLGIAEWLLTYALELASVDPVLKILWAKAQWVGIVTVPTAWFVYVAGYAGRERWLSKRSLALLSVIPVVTLILALTNQWHHLIWDRITLVTRDPLALVDLDREYGLGFRLFLMYSYVLFLLSAFLVIQMLLRTHPRYRSQARALTIASLVPLLATLIEFSELDPTPRFDVIPSALTLTAWIVAWTSYRLRLDDIVPVARETVLEDIADAIIVLDDQDHVLDLNPAARELITAAEGQEAIGRPITELWPEWPAYTNDFLKSFGIGREVTLSSAGEERFFDVRVSPLVNRHGRVTSKALVLRDITERKFLEQQIEERRLYLESVLACAPDAIIALDAQQRILEWNEGAERLFGYSPQEALGRDIDALIAGTKADMVKEATAFTQQVISGEELLPTETVRYRKDGSPVDVIVAGSPIFIQGKLAGVVAVYTDITDQRRAQMALERHAAQLTTLNRISQQITSILDQQELLQRIVDAVQEKLGYARAAILLVDETGQDLYLASATDNFRQIIPNHYRQPLGVGAIGTAAETGKPVLIKDARNDPRPYQSGKWLASASLSAPIKVGEHTIGVLEVEADTPNAFDENDVTVLSTLADQVAAAMENARLYRTLEEELRERKRTEDALRRRTAQLEALRQIGVELSAELDPDALLESIAAHAMELLDGSSGGLYLYRPERDILEWSVKVGPHLAPMGQVLHKGEGLSGKVWETGEALFVDDYRHWEERAHIYKTYPWMSVVAAPIRWGEEFLGVLNVLADTPAAFSAADAELLNLFTAPAAVAIKNAQLFKEAQRQSERLTQTLVISELLHRGLELEQVLQQIAQGAAALGFRRTVINVYEPEERLLRVRATVGLNEQEQEKIHGATYPWPDFQELLQDRFQINHSYLIRQGQISLEDLDEFALSTDIEDRGPNYWRPDDLLLIPLWGSYREPVGVLSVDEPVSGRIPDLSVIRTLETFASQAAIAIENVQLLQAEREQRELAEALEEAAAVVSGTLDLDKVLDRILEQVERVVAGDAFNIMLIEDGSARVVRSRGYQALPGEAPIVPHPSPIPIGHYPHLVEMVSTREPIVIPSTSQDPDWIQEEDREWLRSYVAAPIRVSGVTVGFLNVNGTQPDQFGPDDARRLEIFAHHAAIAVENARLYQQTIRRLTQTQVLREVMMAASSTLQLDQVLKRTIETLRAAMEVELLAFTLLDEEKEMLRLHPHNIGYTHPKEIWFPLDESVCGHVVQTGEPMLIDDVEEIPFYYEFAEGVRSELTVPVSAGGETIGALNVESRVRGAFDKEDLEFYTAIAGQLGMALENARLYEEVRRQAEELAEAVVKLEELDRLKSEFIQNVSHELRSPLALIRGYAEALNTGVLGELAPDQKRPVAIIARRARMLGDLVQDITLVLEAEVSPPEAEAVNLDELIQAAVEDYQIVVDRANLTLETEVSPQLPPVSSSPMPLRRVLDNLISNAIKFTPEKGKIAVRAQQDGDRVTLKVSDTGIGISPDQQKRIFERFYQVDGSTKRRYSGVGLGLALVKEIIEAYEGTIQVESEVGEGSTFTISLPIYEEE